jgi:nucleoside 2-deoxyribosyltransferase
VKIYLAGPINGCTDEEAKGWRTKAKELLYAHETLDPMHRDYREKEPEYLDDIIEPDKADIRHAHVMLVNANRPSWGTAMEIMYAAELTTTRVVLWCDDPKPSPWLQYHSEFISPTLEGACQYIEQDIPAMGD